MTTTERLHAVAPQLAATATAAALRHQILRELALLPSYDARFDHLLSYADKGAGTVTCPGKLSGSHLYEIDMAKVHGSGTDKAAAVFNWAKAAVATNKATEGKAA